MFIFSILIFIQLHISQEADPSASSSTSPPPPPGPPPPPPLPTTEFVKQLVGDSLKEVEKNETTDFWLVIFYRDGGANCIRFMPAFNALSTTLAYIPNLKFGRVDCPNANTTCDNIKGVPTVRFYHRGYFVEYDANRRSNSVDVISAWITDSMANNGAQILKTGIHADAVAPAPVPGTGPLPTTENVRTFTDLDSIRAIQSAGSTDFWFISFYRDSCPHCRGWIPLFNKVSLKLKDIPHLKFGRVDCPNTGTVCDNMGVRGVPTIQFFYKGFRRDYDDARDSESVSKWLLSAMENDGALIKNPPAPPPPPALPSTEYIRNFTDLDSLHAVQTAETTDFWLITYYRDTCPHCRRWIPTFNELSLRLKDTTPNLKFGRVNCADPGAMCADQEVHGIPAIGIYYKGFKTEYNGARDYEEVAKWIPTVMENDGFLVKNPPPPPPPPPPSLPKSSHVEQLDTVWLFKPALENGAGSLVVMAFYGDESPKSQEMIPTFNDVADIMSTTPNVIFGRVNCPNAPKVCDQQHIPKLPTFKIYYKGDETLYYGANDVTAMTAWITDIIAEGGIKKKDSGEL